MSNVSDEHVSMVHTCPVICLSLFFFIFNKLKVDMKVKEEVVIAVIYLQREGEMRLSLNISLHIKEGAVAQVATYWYRASAMFVCM